MKVCPSRREASSRQWLHRRPLDEVAVAPCTPSPDASTLISAIIIIIINVQICGLTASICCPPLSVTHGQKPRSRFCSNSETFLTSAPRDADFLPAVGTVQDRARFDGIGIDVRFNSRQPACHCSAFLKKEVYKR